MKEHLNSIALIIVGIVLIIISLFLVDFDYDKYSTQGEIITVIDEFENNNQDIIIENDNANIILKNAESNKIVVELEYTDKNTMEIIDDKALTIKNEYDSNYFNVGIGYENPTITIYIPNNYEGDIDIESDIGSVSVSDLTLNKLKINNDASKIELENIIVNDFIKLTTDVGNMELKNITSEKLDIEASVGKIDFESIFAKEIEISSEVGSIEGSINGNENDFKKDIDYDLGKSNISSSNEGIYELDVESEIGDIEITFNK